MYVPDGREHVLVRGKERHGDGYRWTSGRTTGETGQFDEHFEAITSSPLVESEKAYYHYEDIKEPTDENVSRYIGQEA